MTSPSARLLLALLPLLAGAVAPDGAASPPAPDLLLITVDTLRPDALGWVAGANETPALDALARQGFRFPAAVAQAPLTLPSHVSLMSGLLPRRHGVRDNGQVLGPGPALLAEKLRARGMATAAFVSGYPLKALFGLARGFDHFDDRVSAGEGAWLERPAAETTAAALDWARAAPRPWFLWVHYYDPHYPYTPPAGLARPGWRGAYDGEVARVDRAVGDLLAGLPPGARLTVFAGDHGESLGEHGEGTHGFFVYDSTVLVPLVVAFPGRVRPGASAAPARLVDVAPTVLELLGLEPDAGLDGVSLAPTLTGAAQEIPPAYAETFQPWTSYGWSPLRSIRHDGWKLIAAPAPELYDLARDPGERHNLVAEERGKAHELKRFLDAAEAAPAAAAAPVTDPETLAALRALGYVGGDMPATGQPGPGLADPKDRVAVREILTAAGDALRRGDFRRALAGFEQVLADEPDNRFAVSRAGEALLRAGDLEAAVARLRQAARLAPASPETRQLLAEALTRAGELDAAIAEWLELIRLQPALASAWSNLGATLGKAGRLDDAVDAMARAVELAPGDPDRLTRLAFAEHAAGRLDAAVGHLRQVVGLAGEAGFAHSGALGLLLLRQGKIEDARPFLARSRPGEGEFATARVELALLEVAAGRPEAARKALGEALAVAPELRPRLASDARLAPLLP